MPKLLADCRGGAAVEFALVIPVLISIVLAGVQYGVMFHAYTVMLNAARDGARSLALGATVDQARARVRNQLPAWVPADKWTITPRNRAATGTTRVDVTIRTTGKAASVLTYLPAPERLQVKVSMESET